MLVKVGSANDIPEGEMRVFEIEGAKVSVAAEKSGVIRFRKCMQEIMRILLMRNGFVFGRSPKKEKTEPLDFCRDSKRRIISTVKVL